MDTGRSTLRRNPEWDPRVATEEKAEYGRRDKLGKVPGREKRPRTVFMYSKVLRRALDYGPPCSNICTMEHLSPVTPHSPGSPSVLK